MTNLEILIFVLGWQGGTIHQVRDMLNVSNISDILDATPDDMRILCRRAQAAKRYGPAPLGVWPIQSVGAIK